MLVSKPIGNNRTKEQGNNEDMKKKGVLKNCSCSYSKTEQNILGITPSSVMITMMPCFLHTVIPSASQSLNNESNRFVRRCCFVACTVSSTTLKKLRKEFKRVGQTGRRSCVLTLL